MIAQALDILHVGHIDALQVDLHESPVAAVSQKDATHSGELLAALQPLSHHGQTSQVGQGHAHGVSGSRCTLLLLLLFRLLLLLLLLSLLLALCCQLAEESGHDEAGTLHGRLLANDGCCRSWFPGCCSTWSWSSGSRRCPAPRCSRCCCCCPLVACDDEDLVLGHDGWQFVAMKEEHHRVLQQKKRSRVQTDIWEKASEDERLCHGLAGHVSRLPVCT